MKNLVRTTINILDLQQGMTVDYNGQLITVSKNDITKNDLFGYSFIGDSSKKTITRVQFAVPTAFGISLR